MLLLMKLDQLDQEIENALSATSSMDSTPTLHQRQLLVHTCMLPVVFTANQNLTCTYSCMFFMYCISWIQIETSSIHSFIPSFFPLPLINLYVPYFSLKSIVIVIDSEGESFICLLVPILFCLYKTMFLIIFKEILKH